MGLEWILDYNKCGIIIRYEIIVKYGIKTE